MDSRGHPVRAAELRPPGSFIAEKIEAELESEGLPIDCLGALDSDAVQVAKTASRSVLGFMSETGFYLDYVVADAGGLSNADAGELNRHLRRRLYSRGGSSTPLELLARRLAET